MSPITFDNIMYLFRCLLFDINNYEACEEGPVKASGISGWLKNMR